MYTAKPKSGRQRRMAKARRAAASAGFRMILTGAALLFAILDGGLRLLPSTRLDNTAGRVIITAAMVGVALVIERLVYRRGPRAALLALGFGRPTARSLAVACAVSASMLAYFPLAVFYGASLRLEADWPWLVVGALVLNGIGEEALFRGFVFGGLRGAGRSFGRAAVLSLLIFAGVHCFLFIDNAPAVAGISVLVAVAYAFPMAYLFERGGSTLWAPALVHAAAHAVRFFDAPPLPVLLGWLLLQVAAPFLVFLFRAYLAPYPAPALRARPRPGAAPLEARR